MSLKLEYRRPRPPSSELNRCPVCGLEAAVRYRHASKRGVYVYKHLRFVPSKVRPGKIKETTYHEAER